MKRSSHSGFMLVVLLTALMTAPVIVHAAPSLGSHASHGDAKASPSQVAKPEVAAPAAADEFGDDAPTIEIPADRQKLIGVKTVVAAVIPLQRTIRTIGRIEYDERGLATINTKIEGWIEKLHVNYTGDYVKKGAPVAEIYSPELYATQQEFLNVLAWTGKKPAASNTSKPYYEKQEVEFPDLLARDAQAMVKASRQRLKLWDISDAQIDRIVKSGIPIRTLTIYSPVSGFVVQKAALQGMRVMPGEKLVDIVDLSTLWVVADIYEKDVPLVKIGQKATISLSNFPGKKIESTIDYIYPLLSGETRTVKARFTIKNLSGELKPQMFTDVLIAIDLGQRLALPEAAVINTGKRRIVYLDHGDGLFEPRDVTTGVRAEGMIEITGGLAPGEKVASQANFLIDSEARLKGVVQ
jgi:membrane fusion protein, copper/silver efflux system